MNVAVLFERSGVVRRALAAHGHTVISVDRQPAADGSPAHVTGDVWDVVNGLIRGLDLVIAHPPCTYVAGSGIHRNKGNAMRQELTKRSLDEIRRVFALADAFPHLKLAVENPVGLISTHIRPATQYIQPYQFGHDASKKTGLWLVRLPALRIDPAQRVAGRMVTDPRTGKTVERWANQTDSGQNRLSPSARRADIRAETYDGIARAMAEQWTEAGNSAGR